MNKKNFVLLMLLVLVVSFAGCNEPQVKPEGKDDEKKDVFSEETIQQILGKAKSIKNIEYEISMEFNDTLIPMSMKVYQKENKYKIDVSMTGQNSIGIFDGKNVYTYDSEQDIYYLMDESGAAASEPIDFDDIAEQALNDASMKELGKEKISGLNTRLVEFSYQPEGQEARKTKAWFSEEYGIPVKLETEGSMGEETVKTTMTLKNIKVNSVVDSVFYVPEDKVKPYEITWEEV